VQSFGGDKLTREDQRWMQEQLYGPPVQALDVEDAEFGLYAAQNRALVGAFNPQLTFLHRPLK
jgi:hypothetical protein